MGLWVEHTGQEWSNSERQLQEEQPNAERKEKEQDGSVGSEQGHNATLLCTDVDIFSIP